MVSVESLLEQFDELGIEPSAEILDKCIEMCINNNINDPVEFVEQWMAYSVSHLNGADPTIDYLRDFERKEIINKKNKNSTRNTYEQKTSESVKLSTNLKIYNKSSDIQDEKIIDSYVFSPKERKHLSRTQTTSDVIFSPVSYSPLSNSKKTHEQELNAGKVIYTFGNSTLLKTISWASTKKQEINVQQIPFEANDELFGIHEKYMYDTLLEKSLLAGDKIYEIGKEIYEKAIKTITVSAGTSENSELQQREMASSNKINHVDYASQDVTQCIGRICSDSDCPLDLTSTIFIGTDEDKLRTVRLNFNQMTKPITIFPGQIVVANGLNPRGDTLFVTDLFSERVLSLPDAPKLIAEPISVIVAAGPYTAQDDLTYELLQDLMTYCKQNKPDILILIGPFLDADNSVLADGVIAESYESYFEKIIKGILDSVGSDTHVLIVSSSKDAHSNMVYPTHPYSYSENVPNLKFLPDPCLVDVAGVKIGITSTDIVRHLSDEELAVNANGDKVKRIVNYLFHQQSFYPLNPPSLDVSLDSGLATKFAQLKTVPNMLLLPSDLKCFVRDVNGCLAINSGRIADKNGGTFGRFVINPPNSETNLFNYVACQIMKI